MNPDVFRAWALANLHLYALMTNDPVPRHELTDGVEDAAAAPLVNAVGGDTDRARVLRALAHGMVSLELAQRFLPDADLDAAWAAGFHGLRTQAPRTSTRRSSPTSRALAHGRDRPGQAAAGSATQSLPWRG
ncbi:MAG: WHG domain-containing protein [Acidimicrobiia bacterium]|nr:WHG domain-containing protein [Acidimicrobiia bacterium]